MNEVIDKEYEKYIANTKKFITNSAKLLDLCNLFLVEKLVNNHYVELKGIKKNLVDTLCYLDILEL